MKQPINPATHFAMLLMALAMAFTFFACGEKVQTDVSSWPQMSVDKFGCMMEETFGYRHEIFNCSLEGYESNPDPCSKEFHDGFPFPDNLVKKVHPLLSKIDLHWQQGKLQKIYFYFDLFDRLTYEEKLKAFGLWNKQPNIMSMDVIDDTGTLILTRFVSVSTKCIRGDSEEEAKKKAACPEKKIGSPKTVEAVWLGSTCGDGCYANARLANGETLILFCKDTDVIDMIENIKEDAKVSVTYRSEQRWESESGCYQEDVLQSVKLLPNGNEAPHEIQQPLTYEGKTYKTVIIGEQTWMAENLNFNAKGSKCYDNNEANCKKYGRLYNWAAAKTVCPSGWHLPNASDWDILMNYVQTDNGSTYTLGSEASIAGKYLKAKSGWEGYLNASGAEENANGVDKYGFAALPGGCGSYDGNTSFSSDGYDGYWWSSSERDSQYAYYRHITDKGASWDHDLKGYLRSVRCVKD
jgi:uncharacterized protein (TIGR02145 family)